MEANMSRSKSAKSSGKTCRATGCARPLDAARSEKVRLCHFHQRELVVEADGQLNRFCQQCMRLHHISKFDGNKRSCRNRLKLQSERFVCSLRAEGFSAVYAHGDSQSCCCAAPPGLPADFLQTVSQAARGPGRNGARCKWQPLRPRGKPGVQ
mmetsp:Transcript_16740/g.46772  ORF Transcript_16740/g.46772 Transcript_16740/m.46772 type:complete len:153 (-) Transcript_16740:3396-3854(-)